MPLEKRLISQNSIDLFWNTSVGKNIFDYIESLALSIRGKPCSCIKDRPVSPVVTGLMGILEEAQGWIRAFPPVESHGRFGNPSFRTWHSQLSKNVKDMHRSVFRLSTGLDYDDRLGVNEETTVIEEVAEYFSNSFGSEARLDYGTGHELNFIIWLYCFEVLGLTKAEDHNFIVFLLFKKYIKMMRELQWIYWLEPAGSQGVWGLDDFHFLPFLFGAAQLISHEHIKPRSIHSKETVEVYAEEYFYLDCIRSINTVKSSSLGWHSPLLNDISAVKQWDKVYVGLLKMYNVEVLHKKPIMQHFLTGKLVHFQNTTDSDLDHDPSETPCCHHEELEFPVCCNIRVPSAISVLQDNKHEAFRIPFD